MNHDNSDRYNSRYDSVESSALSTSLARVGVVINIIYLSFYRQAGNKTPLGASL